MKTLIVWYSRTGTTTKVAEALAKHLKAELAQIKDLKNRDGVVGYLTGGRDAMKRGFTQIAELKKEPKKFDLIVIGTPIWGWNMAPAVRTFIKKYKHDFKKVAFFCTMGGSGGEKTFKELSTACNRRQVAALELKTGEVIKGTYVPKLQKFVHELQ
jgi:menaquinone-dependent protoporphyrinogen IX oxidase